MIFYAKNWFGFIGEITSDGSESLGAWFELVSIPEKNLPYIFKIIIKHN